MPAFQVSNSWKGFVAIKSLFIFGDSYSSTTQYDFSHPTPTPEDPIAVRFPGETYNEPDLPNWVGHLITKYCPEPRFRPDEEQDQEWIESPLLVYNYANGGDTVSGVIRQITRQFLPNAGVCPEWAEWTPDTSLFVTWVGINDCAYACDASHTIGVLFEQQQKLYDAGGRNFLFLDVPPIDRSPAVPANNPTVANNTRHKIRAWNAALREAVHKFASEREDATCLVHSANRLFNEILDDPVSFGFPTPTERSDIWVDHIHPTSKVHDIVAKSIGDFLGSIDPITKG